jgi:hypothetical protein
MKADLSRDTFNPVRHFLRVIQQQGRVEVDADPNEQAAILIRYLQTLAADLIGPYGGPVGDAGFKIAWIDDTIYIEPGRYYVDGVLCELEPGPEVKNEIATKLKDAHMSKNSMPYYEQPDRRIDEKSDPLPQGESLVYLDVWEHHITAIEDPTIREVALGGPDTSTRSKVVCQIKVSEPREGQEIRNCDDLRGEAWARWVERLQSPERGRLAARDNKSKATTDPCITPPMAGYRGAENQLYRVEIRTNGRCGEGRPLGVEIRNIAAEVTAAPHPEFGPVATFVWSRENGSVVSEWDVSDNRIVLADPGRDTKLGIAAGDWIELTDDAHELNGVPGALVKVTNVEDNVLTIDEDSADGLPTDSATYKENPKIRRWDSPGALDVVLPATNDGWIHLEDGVEIKFSTEDGEYRAGDYWLIPARILGGVEWPAAGGEPALQRPRGITHHYAPLGILRAQGGSFAVESCLCLFAPLGCIEPQ